MLNCVSSKPGAGHSVESEVEGELSKLVEENIPKRPPHIEPDVERIRSSIGRLTSNSIDGLGSLSSELQALEKFIEFEVERVQGEIESALAGIKIIIDTIAPWKSTPVSPSTSPRGVPAGPAANIELAQPRR